MPSAKSGSVVNIPLTETQTRGTPGMAVLSQSGPDVLVTIEDPTSASANRAAVIYKGTFAKPSTQAAYKLQPVSEGKSQCTLKGTTVSKLSGGGYALAVNGSPRMCADLVQVNPIPATVFVSAAWTTRTPTAERGFTDDNVLVTRLGARRS